MLQNVIGDYVIMSLNDGYLCLVYNLGSGIFSLKSKFRMQRNIWHTVHLNRSQKSVEMVVDSVDSTSVTSPGRFFELTLGKDHVIYVGGHPDIDSMPREVNVDEGFQGCIRNLKIGKEDINLSRSHVDGRNVAKCSDVCAGEACMRGRCLENADGWFSCLSDSTTNSND
ncbi:hypothetical protein HELRODRAFT_187786 [Helobdella robusta]|uniref:Laminin G domain-containing protein n=1 Tax=Helobdella robusta TaxID=6412 RepID=T1FPD4_HELRO|nr:hypothetical protein HELRODRAFT_187786 [Helobdella robusta]ESO12059.1 hypothetical protein HELRODRAFT_187786 [Helobdella robusta]